MILVNATGFGHHLFALIEQSTNEFLEGSDGEMVINRSLGTGVLTSLLQILDREVPGQVDEVRLPQLMDDDAATSFVSFRPGSILVVDEAQEIDQYPKLTAKIQQHVRDGGRVIYVVTTKLVVENFFSSAEEVVPA